MFKSYVRRRLERYVKKYFKRHPEVKLVIVAGSVGKTTTKIAIGTILAERYRVRLHEGNHNSEVSTPLAILGIDFPDNLRSITKWFEIFAAAKKRVNEPTDVDVIVQEVGTDRIGQVPHFGTYARPDIAVITAVSPEHMEYFQTLDAVAAEELSAANFSQQALINRDDIPGQYAQLMTNPNINTYGSTNQAEYYFTQESFSLAEGFKGAFKAAEWAEPLDVTLQIVGEHSVRAAVAAGAVGVKLGLTADQVRTGLNKIKTVSGSMNVLRGVNESVILDDSYNSSPLAAASALRTLYSLDAPQKIAVLGSMNELGDTSAAEHTALGKLCDPSQLAHVVTVGKEAREFLAPAAQSNGCHVVSFDTAQEAGAFVHKAMQPKSAILFKGSQGGIYLEEGIKVILHSTDDEQKLVRQSDTWLKNKQLLS